MNQPPSPHNPVIDTDDPFVVLGVIGEATEEEIRKRYLELVRLYPPDREPERFRQIHDAYQQVSDPIRLARSLLEIDREPPDPKTILDRHEKLPPRLSVDALLSLGNRTPRPNSDSDSNSSSDSSSSSISDSIETAS